MDQYGEQHEVPTDLRSIVALLRRRKWWLVGASIVMGGAAFTVSSLQAPVYSSSAEILLPSTRSANAATVRPAATANEYQLEVVVMRSSSTAQAVAEKLGWSPSVAISEGAVSGVAVVSASSSSPAEAARHANAFADAYVEVRSEAQLAQLSSLATDLQGQITRVDERIEQIERDLARSDPAGAEAVKLEGERQQLLGQRLAYVAEVERSQFTGATLLNQSASVISAATPSTTPIAPTPRRDGAAGALVGLLLGIGAAFLVSRLDDRLETSDELEHIAGAPALGVIPQVSEPDSAGLQRLAMSDAHSAGAEAYRSLRTALQFIGLERKMQVVLVTSANPGEGKTSTVANLGAALADAGQRVVVIGADLRHPRIGRYFGSEVEIGFTSVLLGEVTLEAALRAVPDHAGLAMLGAGPAAPNPSELLGHPSSERVFEELRTYFDVILVDSPPVLPVSDALVLSRHADATIVVAQAHKTTQRSLRRSITLLRQVGSPIVGSVLNRAGASATYGYGYYGEGAGKKPPATPSRRRPRPIKLHRR